MSIMKGNPRSFNPFTTSKFIFRPFYDQLQRIFLGKVQQVFNKTFASSLDKSSLTYDTMQEAKDNSLVTTQSVIPSPQAKSMTSTTMVSKSKTAEHNTSMAAMVEFQGPKFTLFSKLPPEIRFMIWEWAIVPRLVRFTPAKIPAIFHANRESRRLSKYHFEIRDFNSGIIAHPKKDMIYLDESSFSPSIHYHISALHTISCNDFRTSVTRDIQRVALSVGELDIVTCVNCPHCFLKYNFPFYFPLLKELILIVGQGPAGATAEDLYEITSGNGDAYLQEKIDILTKAFQSAQREGHGLGVKLTLMGMEKWKDLKKNS